MKKTKSQELTNETEKNRCLVSLGIYNIVCRISNFFKFNKKYKIMKKRYIPHLEFETNIITKDPFKNELALFKQFYNLVYSVENIHEDEMLKILKYIKNPKGNMAFNILLTMKLDKLHKVIMPYLSDIKDKYLLKHILEYIEILATFDVLYDALSYSKNEDLLELYNNARLKNLRTIATKTHNKISHSFKWLTGFDNFDENIMKDKLKDIV